MALFGVHGTGTLKRCLTLPTLLERRFIANYLEACWLEPIATGSRTQLVFIAFGVINRTVMSSLSAPMRTA